MPIVFSNYTFTDPIPINMWTPPFRAGLYAIMVHDASCQPKPFRVIYFGESGNMSDRGFVRQHHCYIRWMREALLESGLYISTLLLPQSTAESRRHIETQLVTHYRPSCNR